MLSCRTPQPPRPFLFFLFFQLYSFGKLLPGNCHSRDNRGLFHARSRRCFPKAAPAILVAIREAYWSSVGEFVAPHYRNATVTAFDNAFPACFAGLLDERRGSHYAPRPQLSPPSGGESSGRPARASVARNTVFPTNAARGNSQFSCLWIRTFLRI